MVLERSGPVSGSGTVSGGYRRRCERWAEISTAPAPLTCSAVTTVQWTCTMDWSDDTHQTVRRSVYM